MQSDGVMRCGAVGARAVAASRAQVLLRRTGKDRQLRSVAARQAMRLMQGALVTKDCGVCPNILKVPCFHGGANSPCLIHGSDMKFTN